MTQHDTVYTLAKHPSPGWCPMLSSLSPVIGTARPHQRWIWLG